MYPFSVVSLLLGALLSLSLSLLAAPLPLDQPLQKRGQSGRGTWFYDGLGACGEWNGNNDLIVAISSQIFGTGSDCGRWIEITNTANGVIAYGLTRDECQACGPGDLDMSTGLFQKLGVLSNGVLSITWSFMPTGWSPS